MAIIHNDWRNSPLEGISIKDEKQTFHRYLYNRKFLSDADRRNKLFFDTLDDAYLAINSKSVDCIKIASLLSDKQMSPYRQLATVEKEESRPKRTGLLLAEVPHRCNPPKTYIEVTIKKELFGLIKLKIKKERPMIEDSLYRCPECFKIHRYMLGSYWDERPSHKIMWRERTGDVE